MYIEEEKSIVVIDMPKIVVYKKDASEFIQAVNKFYGETVNTLIDINGCHQIYFDNRYTDGEFIPVLKEKNYTDVLRTFPDVTQYDKYVKLEEADGYGESSQIIKVWEGDNNDNKI